ncbi:5'-nucleotidase C-terminal domain-containing protein [Agrobacterium rosae]|uniref:5'-nucleotidase C-terminal domain-containing protein n=1 Tax=Agrobacterium rosae TaxID=1972867 RepID=A0AAE5S008_9HYPH|nr:5'-nucleotidase C-terminal domain-containing protein [Agrobacterium rosae]KAA3513042.1 LysM peptidoglycan-binding domain-containing protein [Agrobacterium rosae]KAA3521469.1 LysM peptidoglycan-binding domain-containing protein [Agrobacterium rosae]MCM2432666.1 LysM peptidoglycan-binding domain-containing protein [Agrobacterium rosae]MDX8328263.1 5'-nucleotidase C-terminal domain-containing protein [Agrobacterium rosae]MQB48380.1 LysM peptidoglycan-binding domain-containing protein [Agrobact
MNRILRFGLMTASVVSLSAGAALADYQLNILHINDLHSRIEAINKSDSTCSTAEADKKECFGGIARVKSAIDARRTELGANANILVLDAGDQFQGSLFYTQYKSGPVAEFMNGIGFDAMAIGNHEFDDGPAELLKLINAVKFPIISGNTKIADGSELKDKFKGYIIKEMGGQKVAVVSVLATDTNETSSPGDKVTFEDEIEYLKGAVKEIQDQGVNKIVVLSHVGYVKDQEIARSVDGIDVIVGGHSHTLLSSTDPKAAGPYPTLVKDPSGVEVPIVTAYAYSKYLGDLTVTFDDNGVVKSTSGAPKLLDASVTPDEAFTKRVTELAAPLEAVKAKEIGTSEAAIDGSREVCRAKECTMGNLVSDALLDRVKDQGITIAIQNGGGLRASIDAGPVTMGEVLTVLPFQNSIATFQIKGVDLLAALENGAGQIEEGAGRFVQTAGLKYSFDRSKPAGSRIVSVEVKEGDAFVKLDPEKTYGVVTNNYTRTGGDGFKTFATKAINPYDFGPSLEDAVAAYIGAHSPYKPYLDGRVADVTPADYVAPPKEAKPATPAPATTAQAPATATPPAATPPAAPAPTATAPATPAPATTTSAAATTPAAAGKYVVARGDSLWKIAAEKYGNGLEWKKIAEANALKRPNHIEVGEELNVPAQ